MSWYVRLVIRAKGLHRLMTNKNKILTLVAGLIKIEDVLSREEMIKLSDHMPVVAVFKADNK